MLTITLTPDLERAATARAQEQGTTAELIALDTLRQHLLPSHGEHRLSEGTLADLLGDSIGCLDSSEFVQGGARMSENIGDKFATVMLEKRDRGRLRY